MGLQGLLADPQHAATVQRPLRAATRRPGPDGVEAAHRDVGGVGDRGATAAGLERFFDELGPISPGSVELGLKLDEGLRVRVESAQLRPHTQPLLAHPALQLGDRGPQLRVRERPRRLRPHKESIAIHCL